MPGISAATCISLILARIGGIPLRPAIKMLVEGAPPAKQLGGISTDFTGLSAMAQSLSGVSIPCRTTLLNRLTDGLLSGLRTHSADGNISALAHVRPRLKKVFNCSLSVLIIRPFDLIVNPSFKLFSHSSTEWSCHRARL